MTDISVFVLLHCPLCVHLCGLGILTIAKALCDNVFLGITYDYVTMGEQWILLGK